MRGENKPDIEALVSLLGEELSVYEKLCGLSLEKKEAVLKNDVDLLAKIIGEERALIVEAERLESRRISETSRIARELGLEGNVKISDLKRFLEEDDFHRLESIAEKLKSVLNKLKEINETNRYLVESTLRYISYMIDALMNSISKVTYGKGKSPSSTFSLFEREA